VSPQTRACVVLPTYEEATNLERLAEALLALDPPLSLLVVDDDSPDGTGEIAEALAAREPRVRVERRHGVRGLGGALKQGLRSARARGFERVAAMDADFSHDPERLPALVAALDAADLVLGSRYVPGGRVVNWSAWRRLLSAAANAFVAALFRLPVRDSTAGFRAYSGALLDALPWDRIVSTGYAFQVEVVVRALDRPGTRVVELPIEFRERARGRSKLGLAEAFVGLHQLPRLRFDADRRRARRSDA
jgi:glycosyltransferase involved in cell wall biosynthesis